jgi:hypothetical protein
MLSPVMHETCKKRDANMGDRISWIQIVRQNNESAGKTGLKDCPALPYPSGFLGQPRETSYPGNIPNRKGKGKNFHSFPAVHHVFSWPHRPQRDKIYIGTIKHIQFFS